MDRRELLKMFGAGSVIAPVVGGIAAQSPHVKLIQEPVFEIAKPATLPMSAVGAGWSQGDLLDVTLYVRCKRTGRNFRVDCDAFSSSVNHTFIPVCYDGMTTRYRSRVSRTVFEATGPISVVEGAV